MDSFFINNIEEDKYVTEDEVLLKIIFLLRKMKIYNYLIISIFINEIIKKYSSKTYFVIG